LEVPALEYDKMTAETDAEDSSAIRRRVQKARQLQQARFLNDNLDGHVASTNSEMNLDQIKKYCVLDNETKNLVRQAVGQMHLTMRSYHRLLKTARTIADLAESENILASHVAEALQYRINNNN
jgi:magnesium chelatase family protein